MTSVTPFSAPPSQTPPVPRKRGRVPRWITSASSLRSYGVADGFAGAEEYCATSWPALAAKR
jgi:hypothetical protein